MNKIEFKNFPDLTTPLSANNLNQLQENVENVFNGTETMGNIVVDSIQGKNLFNYQSTTGGWIDSNNSEKSTYADTYCYTEYIQVKPNTTYTLDFYNSTGLSGASILQYDNSRAFLYIAITENLDIITFTTSANTYYVRFTCRQDCKQNVQFEKGSSATHYSEYKGLGYVSGSNANGNYIKYDDGTLMCWKDYSMSTTIENTWGALYESSTFNVGDLAIPFVGHWDFIVSQQSGPGSMLEVGWNSNNITINIASAVKRTSTATYHFAVMGIGRWK